VYCDKTTEVRITWFHKKVITFSTVSLTAKLEGVSSIGASN